jgi:Adenylate and Guanylate cyclase catalytic domain
VERPDTHYAWNGDSSIAYQVVGDGPVDLVYLQGQDYFPWAAHADEVVREVERFLASVRAEEADLDRALATVLFTDIVGSTEKLAEVGDAAWRDLVERHHATVRALLARYGGREIDTAGDGRCRGVRARVRDRGEHVLKGVPDAWRVFAAITR